jgi:hypothetical protein
MVCELWQGANSYAFARAFRRMGHSVTILSDSTYNGFSWKSRFLKAARRLLTPWIQAEFETDFRALTLDLRPHLVFVCKGQMVTGAAIRAAKESGAVAVLWWPDVSFFAHGRNIPEAMPHYDWIFTTKTFGMDDLRDRLGVTNASFMAHGFDPETHMKFACDDSDRARYGCDVSFIGTWSPKKQSLLEILTARIPDLSLRIWGNQWEKAGGALSGRIMHKPVLGAEYAKAIQLSGINLGFLAEIGVGASSGDLVTSRTFHIPACGGFMLHERTDEVRNYFVEDEECALFGDVGEMIAKIEHFRAHPRQRAAIAEAGRQRALKSGYSIDDRARAVLIKVDEISALSDTSRSARS